MSAKRRVETPRVSLAHYSASDYREQEITDLAASIPFLDDSATTWLNVDGIHQTEVVSRIGDYLGLHPLLLEDLVNTAQRPKFENYGNCLFFVLKMLTYDPDGHSVDAEQVSIVLGAGLRSVVSGRLQRRCLRSGARPSENRWHTHP